MPAGVDSVQMDGDYSAILHKIEGIVIKWTHQVKSVLELKSEQALIDGKNPGPQEELKFWSDLASNLQCIYEQLCSPKVKKMGKLLKEKESSQGCQPFCLILSFPYCNTLEIWSNLHYCNNTARALLLSSEDIVEY